VPPDTALIFEALIVPHRSLTRKGLATVVSILAVSTAAVALRFWMLGAWPVVAFSLIEIPLLVVLLAINRRWARASELIMLNTHELTIVRTDPRGLRQRVCLPSAWLRIDLETGRGIPRIMLSNHRHRCEIGAFLHEPERIALFEELRNALNRSRNPQFDNLQLRDC
jgi:uncharacterized membrane protein